MKSPEALKSKLLTTGLAVGLASTAFVGATSPSASAKEAPMSVSQFSPHDVMASNYDRLSQRIDSYPEAFHDAFLDSAGPAHTEIDKNGRVVQTANLAVDGKKITIEYTHEDKPLTGDISGETFFHVRVVDASNQIKELVLVVDEVAEKPKPNSPKVIPGYSAFYTEGTKASDSKVYINKPLTVHTEAETAEFVKFTNGILKDIDKANRETQL